MAQSFGRVHDVRICCGPNDVECNTSEPEMEQFQGGSDIKAMRRLFFYHHHEEDGELTTSPS